MKPRRHVLVVDQDKSEQELVSSIVAGLGADIHWCESATDGRALAERQKIDAIILDILVPDNSGYELFGALKAAASTSDIPILLVTARHRADDVLEGFASLAYDFLVRPFRPRELRARLRNALRTTALLEDLRVRVRFYERCLRISRSLAHPEDAEHAGPRIAELMADIADAYSADGVSISIPGRPIDSWGDLEGPAAVEIPRSGGAIFRIHRATRCDAEETSRLVELSELLLTGLRRLEPAAGRLLSA
ncbi:MAG: response regulator [Thermoanaerobaculia bacterium]